MAGKYDDIIHLSRPDFGRRAKMPLANRGAQFAPFAALVGYEDVLTENTRIRDAEISFSEDAIAMVDAVLQQLARDIDSEPTLRITYFEQEPYRLDGYIRHYTGKVKKLDRYRNVLVFADGPEVEISCLYQAEILDSEVIPLED